MDELLRALAHTDRRTFVKACLGRLVPAGELAERSNLALASVSEHLKVLRKTGLLVLEREGRFRRYKTDKTLLKALSQAVAQLEDQ